MKYEDIEINIPGKPGPWLKQNGKFYCYFRTDNDKFSSGLNSHFYILDKTGKIESEVPVPEVLQTFYYDLYVMNDTIFTTEYYHQNTFFLDEKNKKWVETKKGIDLFYSDKDFDIFSLDFGEWGGTSWFREKSTGNQYELRVSAPIINKLNDSYFITLYNRILKIDDPKNLMPSKNPYDYQKAISEKGYYYEGSQSMKGAEIIYSYKNKDYFNPTFSFTTSFVANHQLFHVYKDSISCKIGQIRDGKLVHSYEFKEKINPVKWSYDWRFPIQNNSFQTFQFYAGNKNTFGIVEINGSKILVSTFKNTYKELELAESEMNHWFEESFDFYCINFNDLYLKDIDSVEQKIGSTNITPKHKVSHYLLDGKDVETPRAYRKFDTSGFQLNTSYYYTTNEKSVELIEFEWKIKQTAEDVIASILKEDSELQKYKSKFEMLSDYLTAKLGEPTKNENRVDWATQEWDFANQKFILKFTRNGVEFRMYKK